MSRGNPKVYVGNLSSRTRESDLEHLFRKFGPVTRCDVKMGGYAFVHFESSRDAEDAIREMDGTDYEGRELLVEPAKGPAPNRGGYSGVSNLRGTRSGYRLVVSNMAPRTSWQDLKDFAREAGSVRFTDVWVEKGKKYGVIEYASRDDYEEALRKLDDTKLDGNRIRLKPENSRDRSSSRSRSASRSRGRRSRSRSGSRSRSRSRRTRRRSSDRRRDRSKSRSLSRDRKRSPSRDRKRSPSKPKSPVKNNTKEEQPPASADANAPANNTPPAESARAKSASPGKSPARASPPRAD